MAEGARGFVGWLMGEREVAAKAGRQWNDAEEEEAPLPLVVPLTHPRPLS